MATKTNTPDGEDPKIEADRVVQDLAKIAFASISDFAQFRDGSVIDIDHVKAREAGAKVTIVTRKVGLIRRRGRSLSPAAQQLYDLFSEVKGRRRTRRESGVVDGGIQSA